MKFTNLSFDILKTNNCKLLAILDTSTYSSEVTDGNLMQIQLPDKQTIVELPYTKEGVTILNSNNLGYTNVNDPKWYETLPDGVYTIKISVCPRDKFWAEKDIYRTCNLECKWYNAFLKLDVKDCQKCYSEEKLNKLNLAWTYIQGCIANANNDNLNTATELYSAADKLIISINDNCKC